MIDKILNTINFEQSTYIDELIKILNRKDFQRFNELSQSYESNLSETNYSVYNIENEKFILKANNSIYEIKNNSLTTYKSNEYEIISVLPIIPNPNNFEIEIDGVIWKKTKFEYKKDIVSKEEKITLSLETKINGKRTTIRVETIKENIRPHQLYFNEVYPNDFDIFNFATPISKDSSASQRKIIDNQKIKTIFNQLYSANIPFDESFNNTLKKLFYKKNKFPEFLFIRYVNPDNINKSYILLVSFSILKQHPKIDSNYGRITIDNGIVWEIEDSLSTPIEELVEKNKFLKKSILVEKFENIKFKTYNWNSNKFKELFSQPSEYFDSKSSAQIITGTKHESLGKISTETVDNIKKNSGETIYGIVQFFKNAIQPKFDTGKFDFSDYESFIGDDESQQRANQAIIISEMNNLYEMMGIFKELNIEIIGHTDSKGLPNSQILDSNDEIVGTDILTLNFKTSVANNYNLSFNRALSFGKYLNEVIKLPSTRISLVKGVGEKECREAYKSNGKNGDDEIDEEYRKVEIKYIIND